jgi:hypothetical protein
VQLVPESNPRSTLQPAGAALVPLLQNGRECRSFRQPFLLGLLFDLLHARSGETKPSELQGVGPTPAVGPNGLDLSRFKHLAVVGLAEATRIEGATTAREGTDPLFGRWPGFPGGCSLLRRRHGSLQGKGASRARCERHLGSSFARSQSSRESVKSKRRNPSLRRGFRRQVQSGIMHANTLTVLDSLGTAARSSYRDRGLMQFHAVLEVRHEIEGL